MSKPDIAKLNRVINSNGYSITVDNSSARAFNINIDWPTFFCFAISKEEALGKMMLSDFKYKKYDIISINCD